MRQSLRLKTVKKVLMINLKEVSLQGHLSLPERASGVVIFAHGSGSSRLSPRNRFVADYLLQRKIGTLLFDLLTEEEEERDILKETFRFNIPFLAERLVEVTDWLVDELGSTGHKLPLGYFGASTGAAAALMASVRRSEVIRAVVSRGGRPDLAGEALSKIVAPTLLIIGSCDTTVLGLNRQAFRDIPAEKDLHIVEGATHLFEEEGALEEVAEVAAQWFESHFEGKKERGQP